MLDQDVKAQRIQGKLVSRIQVWFSDSRQSVEEKNIFYGSWWMTGIGAMSFAICDLNVKNMIGKFVMTWKLKSEEDCPRYSRI